MYIPSAPSNAEIVFCVILLIAAIAVTSVFLLIGAGPVSTNSKNEVSDLKAWKRNYERLQRRR